MGLLLDLAYLALCLVLSPWLLWRLANAANRGDLKLRLGFGLGPSLARSIWLHGSSAGEVTVLKPLVELLERDHPATPLVVSAFTATGLAAARKLYPRHRVIALPLDFSFVVRRFLRHFDPRLLVVVESEFWPNLLGCARTRGVPVALVNGKMSAKSYRAHSRAPLIPHVLAKLDLLAVQTPEHADRLRALGVGAERISVTGNMKYDLAPPAQDDAATRALRSALGYADGDVVIIGGSLHEREDEALLDAFARACERSSRAALIIVPRYPADAASIEQHARQRGHRTVRKTAIDAGIETAPGRAGVLIVDTVGELGRLYAVADVAFVGGSLFFRGANKGGHNLMEPAIAAVPVLFGPYNFSFKETVEDLLAAHAGILVRDVAELGAALGDVVADDALRRELGLRAERVVRAGQGATARNYRLLERLLRAGSAVATGGLTPQNAGDSPRT
jgi:3-deoxy-D-manno-octulosonic-acid transferase